MMTSDARKFPITYALLIGFLLPAAMIYVYHSWNGSSNSIASRVADSTTFFLGLPYSLLVPAVFYGVFRRDYRKNENIDPVQKRTNLNVDLFTFGWMLGSIIFMVSIL